MTIGRGVRGEGFWFAECIKIACSHRKTNAVVYNNVLSATTLTCDDRSSVSVVQRQVMNNIIMRLRMRTNNITGSKKVAV
jgi:hypothetical protein